MLATSGYNNNNKKKRRVRQLELCDRSMFGDMVLTCQSYPSIKMNNEIRPIKIIQPVRYRTKSEGSVSKWRERDKRRASALMDQLLIDIYGTIHNYSDYNSATSSRSHKIFSFEKYELERKGKLFFFIFVHDNSTNFNFMFKVVTEVFLP